MTTSDNSATLRDIEKLLTTVSMENFYVKPEEYRRIIGIGRTQLHYLRKAGKLDAGMHPSTLGKKRILIHKYYNIQSGNVEWFRVDKVIPNKRGRKVGYRKKKAQQETILAAERAEDATLNSQSA